MRHDEHARPSITTQPHRRVATLGSTGWPSCARLSNSASRRSGTKWGNVPSFVTRGSAAGAAAAGTADETAMCSLPRRSAKYAATAAAAPSGPTPSTQAPAGTPSTTCTRASLPQASNRALDVAATRRAVATPCSCSQREQSPHASRIRRTPSTASPLVSDSSTRPKHTTFATWPSSSNPPAARRSCSHATTTSSPTRAPRHACASCASLGLRASSALVGHTVAHVPHPTHFAASTRSSPSASAIQPDVHASAHFKHATLRLRTFAHRSRCTTMASLDTPSSTPTILRFDRDRSLARPSITRPSSRRCRPARPCLPEAPHPSSPKTAC